MGKLNTLRYKKIKEEKSTVRRVDKGFDDLANGVEDILKENNMFVKKTDVTKIIKEVLRYSAKDTIKRLK